MKKIHSHKLTNILKFTLFGFIMLAPIFAVASKCLYVGINPNAQESYSEIKEIKTTNITQYTWNSQTLYNLKYIAPSTQNSSVKNLTYMSLTASDLGITQENYNTLTKWYLRADNQVWFSNDDQSYIVKKSLTLNIFKNWNIIGEYPQNLDKIFNINYTFITEGTLDNVFYYAIEQLSEQPIFNWTENTAIYTTINNMCVGLEFGESSNTLALLLSYWFLNTMIYIVVDIIVYSFTWLTHLLIKEKDN